MKRALPYASLVPIALELVGFFLRPEGTKLSAYMWVAAPVSIVALICSTFLTDWQCVAATSWRKKTFVVFLLYWGLATAFSFAYTIIYFHFSSSEPAFSISSDISLKAFQTEREAIVIRVGGTRRLAYTTAAALIRDPGATTKFIGTAMDPFHTTPPYVSAFLRSVASSSERRALKDSLASLSPIERFQASEYMHQYFAVPRKSDEEIYELSRQLKPDLIALRDRYEVSGRLKDLGFAVQAEEKLREVYLHTNDPMARRLMQAHAATAINLLDAAEDLIAEERQKYETIGHTAETWESHVHFLYFSFITIATVGFGDIVPNSMLSRLAVILEVSWGIYIIAMLLTTVLQNPRRSERSGDR